LCQYFAVFFLLALALIWVASINIVLASKKPFFTDYSSIHAEMFSNIALGKARCKGITHCSKNSRSRITKWLTAFDKAVKNRFLYGTRDQGLILQLDNGC